MEQGPTRHVNLDRQYLHIDRENLESQLRKIREVLLEISKNYRFDTFSHFEKLAGISSKDGVFSINILDVLDKWDYDSLDFTQMEGRGNCVDFALLCQKMLSNVGVPTTIIGRFPEKDDYTPAQTEFLKFRHTTPMYVNEFNGLKVFILEPSWKFSDPVPVELGIPSVYKDWRAEITKIDGTQFTQLAYNAKKNKRRERRYDIHPLSIEWCQQLTKRFIRVPRELKILNTRDEEVIQFVKFDAARRIFTTNINGVDQEFYPDSLTSQQVAILEDVLGQPGLLEYLSKVFEFIKSLPNDFWVRD